MKFTYSLLAMTTLLASCSAPKPTEADLVLLFTTDLHGACLPFDFKKNEPAQTSLANVCTYVNQQREEHPDAVMLFDTGDFLQGQPSIYYSNFVDTLDAHIMPSVYNYLHYDAVGVGNHDIETGEDVYGRRLPKQFEMPWLCANAIDQRTGRPMFQPYTVIERQGIKIAILGMITPNIHAWLPKTLWPNLEFEDMVECASKWVPVIQQKEQPDLLIGLFHAGYDYTVGSNDLDTPFNENGSVPTAIKVPGFDIVLCGHDHQPRMFNVANVAGDSVLVLDAQTQAKKVGRAAIHLQLVDGKYQKTITPSLVEMDGMAEDAAFCAHFQPFIDEVNQYVDASLGELSAPLFGEPSLYGPSEFQDFIHEAQLWATGADISFASVLAPHDMIPAGPITMRQLFTLYKYENQLFTLAMTGEEVQKYLEYGFKNQFNTMVSESDYLLAYKKDAGGKYIVENGSVQNVVPTFNYTSAAGIRHTVDITKPAGERVNILSMSDGSAFDPAKTYKVAINSYQASGGGGFVPVGLGWDDATLQSRIVDASPKDVRRYISEYIQQLKTIHPQLRGDWEVIPVDLWKKGIENEKKHFNPNQR